MMHSWKLKTAGDGGVGIKRRGRRGGCGGRPDNATRNVCAVCPDVFRVKVVIHPKAPMLRGSKCLYLYLI